LHKTLHLRDVEGLSTRETAELLGLTEGAVKTQVSRARIKLKKLVQEDLEKKCAAV
jgi:RNA polymerase sigma-70 factor (ECF subfamily)